MHSSSKHARPKRAKVTPKTVHPNPNDPAPGLMKRRVVLTSVFEISGSTIAGNGFQRVYVSPNGFATPDTGSPSVPQKQIWDQYAKMYDYYQVEYLSATIYPYKFESTTSTAGVNPVSCRPIYSCIDPNSDSPNSIDGFASYGNMKVTLAYQPHSRQLAYHQLGLQKQSTLILKTGGSSGSREQYTTPAQLAFFGQNPAFKAEPFCSVVFTINYVFSGLRNPTVQVNEPQSLPEQIPVQTMAGPACIPAFMDDYQRFLQYRQRHLKEEQ